MNRLWPSSRSASTAGDNVNNDGAKEREVAEADEAQSDSKEDEAVMESD